jgi:Ran GTPase-activating protein (RanGAP) involved in mRNA processing and transport
VMFEWSGPVKRSCCLVMDGSEAQEMIADNETQTFSYVLNLPAGRYMYRFKVDGSYTLRQDKPSVDTGSKDSEFDPANMRNLLIVVPHSSDPNGDEFRKPIQTVSLPMRSLGDDGVWVLKQRLRLNKNVTCLDLPSNSISTDGACALGGLLAERPGMLMRLNLSSNGIGYEGALALALGLQRNHSLTSLELYQNRLGDDGCETLAGGLQGHRALLNLELGGNFIHCDGACALASSLFGNYSLVKVGLSNNSIGPRGVDAMCNVLLANRSLVDVDFSHNPDIGVSGACSLGKYLADKDCNIVCLGLSGCRLSGQKEQGVAKGGIRALSIGLARNSTLRRLSLADNNIDNTGARELAVALQENTWLISLDLESNSMDDDWLRPAHTLHTDQDPSIRSIASNILRNAHIHKVDGEYVSIGTRKWDTEAGVPGMVIASGNRGDQVAARREKMIAVQLEEERLRKMRGQSQEDMLDEATLAEAPYEDGDERNFIQRVVGDPLDVVATAIRNRKGMVGHEGKDGVWRLEGRWVRRSTAAPPSSKSLGTQGSGPRWLSHADAAAESAERREVSLAAAEKVFSFYMKYYLYLLIVHR